LTYKDDKDLTPFFLGFAEGATALKENSAEALAIVSGIPNASLADVQTVTGIRLLPNIFLIDLWPHHSGEEKFT
jgi:TRAP-type uncharacterized transport system substrate-binding protein